MRTHSLVVSLALGVAIGSSGCGVKGPLRLPQQPAATPSSTLPTQPPPLDMGPPAPPASAAPTDRKP